jgi:phenylacetate-coenzyme A ligase PaaK-like adenylate-forming protein
VLDTAVRQLRYGVALLRNRRVRVDDLRRMVDDILATQAELGVVGDEQRELMQGSGLDPEARATFDAKRWRTVVAKAYEETAWYRDRLDRLGLAPADLTLERRTELPPTPKQALRASPEAFVSSRSSPVFQATTTGTTGIPTSIWFSRYELDLAAGLAAVSFLLTGQVGPDDVVQICISSRALLGVGNTAAAARLVGAATVLIGMIDPAEALSRAAHPVHLPGKKRQVSVLTTHPSYLAALVAEAQRSGYRPEDFGLERIISGGEVLSDALRRRAEATFGVPVLDGYAMTEIFPIAGIVCDEGHLHIPEDQGLVEVLDPVTNEPAAPGQVGQFVVTPYYPYRDTTLVLRLATGDLVRALPEPPTTCEFAALPATSPLLGKATLSATAGGRPVYQRDVLEVLEAEPAVPLPVRYALDPADDGVDLHVRVVEDDDGLRDRLEAAAAARGLPLRKLVLHDDDTTMPPPQFMRAWLRETTIVRDGSGTWALR